MFENLVLDSDRCELRRGDTVLLVQPQVFDLLEYLIRNRDRVVSKDDLLDVIWGGRIVSESTLDSRISAARTAIGDGGKGQRLIRTLRRKGIRFVGAVQEEKRLAEGAAAATSVVEPKAATAERRQLTIASCELLLGPGSARDPEDFRDAIGAWLRCVSETAARFNGFVSSPVGNTVLIYFGYPAAQEHDGEQAVHAGLELCVAVPRIAVGPHGRASLKTRVGIGTGLMVTGDLIGAGEARRIVGEAPSLAAQLHGLAAPNMVVVADSTRRLLGNLFEFRDLGLQNLNGIAEPVRAWTALRAGSFESRFEALHASDLTALVGREEESELLLRRWSRAKRGEGQLVLLSGEAGIGKSRLTAEFSERVGGDPHVRLRYFCSPQHVDSAFYPIIGQMARAAGLAQYDSPQGKLDKLDALLAQTSTSAQNAALFAEMLSLPNDGRYPALALTPQQIRQKTLDALIGQIQVLSRQTPVLMIFEDIHWSDPTSLETFGRMVDGIRMFRALLIATLRPEFEPPWIGRPHVTALTISRLAEREVGAMVDRIVGDTVLRANSRQDIIERSDGVPLFVEEMTKSALEAEKEGEAWRPAASAVASPTLAVPASLYASLMARLDRLEAAREVMQIGAAIGREFSHALLAAVAPKPEAALAAALDRLVASGLLFRQGVPPDATYLFKHALVQDVAYGTLPREPRRALHTRIADTLKSQFSEIAENQPEVLARHYSAAGLIETAADFWGNAGQRSLARSALAEAAEQLAHALAQIAALPTTPSLRRKQVRIQVALASALMLLKGYAAPAAKVAQEQARLLIEQAEALGEPPEDPLLLFSVIYGLWAANYVKFNGNAMRGLAAEFMILAGKAVATVPLMMGHRTMGFSLLLTGDIREAQTHLNRAIALYDSAKHRQLATRFGADIGVSILCSRSLALSLLGYPEAGLVDTDRAIKSSHELGHRGTLVYALIYASLAHLCRANYAAAKTRAQEVVALADETGALFGSACGEALQGCVLAATGKASEAVQIIGSGMAALLSTGATLWAPMLLSYLTGAYAELGDFDNARHCIGEAMISVEATEERWWEAEVYRVAGEIAIKSPEQDATKAETYFERALAVARKQQAKSWELRTAMSLARLRCDQGKRDEARDLLAPVYNWFTEGFDTLHLTEARALLAALGP